MMRLLSWAIFDLQVAFLRTSAEEKPDFIIASTPSLFTPLASYFLAKRTGAKLITEVRDIWPLTGVEEYGYSPRHPFVKLANLIEKFSYSRSAGVVGLMPRIRAHVEEVVDPAPPVTSIGLGLDDEVKPHQPFGLPRDPTQAMVIGYAGTVGKSNGLQDFFEAARLLQGFEGVMFEVAGTGDQLDFFQRQYGSLSNLKFHGRLSRIDAQNFIRNCHVAYFASPDTRVSGFGQSLNKIVEYMYASRPILGSFSGFLTMVNEAKAGWVVPAGNAQKLAHAIKQLKDLSGPELDMIGRNGFRWITKYRSYKKLSESYLTFLEEL